MRAGVGGRLKCRRLLRNSQVGTLKKKPNKPSARRVLYIIHSGVRSGPQRMIEMLARGLAPERYTAAVAAPLRSPLADALRNSGTPVFDWPGDAPVRTLLRTARAFAPDILHVHLGPDMNAARAVRLLSRARLVYTAHIRGDRHDWIKNRLHMFCHKAAHIVANRLTSHVIAVSECVREDYIARQNMPAEKVSVIPNAVDFARYDVVDDAAAGELRRQWLGDASGPLVSLVSRLAAEKGQGTIVKAWAQLAAAFPEARLIIFGSGPDREHIQRMIEERGLNRSVILAGEAADVCAVMKASDFALFPTEFESFGMTGVEALAAGTPLIASRLRAVCETLKGCKAVTFAPPGDVDAWRQVLETQFTSWRGRCGADADAVCFVRERYSLDAVARRTMDCYDAVLR